VTRRRMLTKPLRPRPLRRRRVVLERERLALRRRRAMMRWLRPRKKRAMVLMSLLERFRFRSEKLPGS
jgi:hypothetical protein